MICYAILNEDDGLETTVLASSEAEALQLATTQFDTESWYAVPWSTWIFGTVERGIAPIRARLANLNANALSVGDFHAYAAHDVQTLLKAIDHLRAQLEDKENP